MFAKRNRSASLAPASASSAGIWYRVAGTGAGLACPVAEAADLWLPIEADDAAAWRATMARSTDSPDGTRRWPPAAPRLPPAVPSPLEPPLLPGVLPPALPPPPAPLLAAARAFCLRFWR